jgi:iron complex outermembrane receptor protein
VIRIHVGPAACGGFAAVLVLCRPAAAEQTTLEEIVVTGTRIVRPDFVSASPIVSIDEQRFQDSAANTVESVINSLPQFVANFGSTSNNPGNGGQANLSLRGLPTTATLVLVDGRRLMPANGTGVTDVNVIPPSLIESVEVITGGASAVYGSDAIAGVVNFKLRHDMDGVEVDATGAVTDAGDGEEYSFGLTAGTTFADGRGSLMGYAGYADRRLVTYGDREFSRYGYVYAGPGQGTIGPKRAFVPQGSMTVDEGSARLLTSEEAFDALFASYGLTPDETVYSQTLEDGTVFNRDFGFNLDGTLFTMGLLPDPDPHGVANFRGPRDPVTYTGIRHGYNFAPPNALQLPLERTSLFARGEFEFDESARVYAQGLYADYSSTVQLAPTPVMFVPVPLTNPYIPDDLRTLLAARANPTAPFAFSKRMSALGPRVDEHDYAVFQLTLGLDGRLSPTWRYDAYAQFGRNSDEARQTNNVRRSRLLELLNAADGGESLCGGWDPFGHKPISAACASYIAIDGTNRSNVEQRIFELTASGPVVAWPAGEVRVALGAMYKQDEYRYRADPISKATLPDGNQEVIGFSAAQDIDGDDHNIDLYLEASLPLLRDLPGVRSLEAVVGYRWSDYASAGVVDAYKGELLYRPVDSVRMRTSYQHAVRAPSVYELYLPQLGPEVFFDERDPCSVDSSARSGPDRAQVAQVEALCLAQGFPADLLPTYSYLEASVPGVAGGNPDLGAEEADTITAGIVFGSPWKNLWLDRLQLSIDWYRIEVEDAILVPPAAAFIPRCYDPTYNPTFSIDNPFCTYFTRDTETGVIFATEIYRNVGLLRTSGVDLQLDWSVEAGPGTAGLNWLVGYVDSYQRSGGPGIPADEIAGMARGVMGGSVPRWKWNLRASYAWSDLDLTLQWRYIDSMYGGFDDPKDWKIPSTDYFDLYAGFGVEEGLFAGLTVTAGIENLTDQDPPIFPRYVQANTDPSVYDVLGRRYFARMTYRF